MKAVPIQFKTNNNTLFANFEKIVKNAGITNKLINRKKGNPINAIPIGPPSLLIISIETHKK